MLDVLDLALPFFGLIFLGFACGKLRPIPDSGLAWMDFFVIWLALPALFYRVLARTPVGELAQVWFIVATTLATFAAFLVTFAIAFLVERGRLRETTIIGLAGAYGNVGYMGPGLALSALGTAAAAPVALVFCFDTLLVFSLAPFLMAVAGGGGRSMIATGGLVLRRILLHPFIVASALGVLSAAVRFEPPVALDRLLQFLQNAAAPCALFALGVTVAARPVGRIPPEAGIAVGVKLFVHPVIALALLALLGRLAAVPFAETWVYAAVLLAALPPALSVFVVARQYDVWVAEASTTILLGTVVSALTVTAVLWLVKTHTLPLGLLQ